MILSMLSGFYRQITKNNTLIYDIPCIPHDIISVNPIITDTIKLFLYKLLVTISSQCEQHTTSSIDLVCITYIHKAHALFQSLPDLIDLLQDF